MPCICRFHGIAIYMYFRDHGRPHFHAEYAEHKARVEIDTKTLLSGRLPRRVLSLVLEWAADHADELLDNWERARSGLPLEQIAPLD